MARYDFSGQAGPEHLHYSNQSHFDDGYDYPDETQDTEGAAAGGRSLAPVVNVLGAAASLALVVGVAVWGYKLVMRDVSGVPVVRAAEGPMRVQPDNPGGTPADHQGLAVNAVAAVGAAAPPAGRLILAPRPVSLTDEDAPMGALKPIPAVQKTEEVITDLEAAELRQGAAGAGQLDALEPTPGVQLAALTMPDDEPAIDPADLAAQLPDPELAVLPGVRRSLRPLTRPAGLRRMTPVGSAIDSDAVNAAVTSAMGLDLNPETLAKGTRLAQLGAFESPEVARAEWDRLYARFGEYMAGKQRVIQETSRSGRTFYRLRVHGFADLSDSRQFCAALVAQNADCIPVAVR